MKKYIDTIKCPYCGYEDDKCYFPDYFEYNEEVKSDLNNYGINIVTCGMCGKALVQEDWESEA